MEAQNKLSAAGDILKEIEEVGKTAASFFDTEISKFIKILSEKISEINRVLVDVTREYYEIQKETEMLTTEVAGLKKDKKRLLDFKDELDKQAAGLKSREENLVELSKVLDNKQKMLNAREEEIIRRERRVKDIQ